MTRFLLLPLSLLIGGAQIALDHLYIGLECLVYLCRDDRRAHHGESVEEDRELTRDCESEKDWWV